MKKRKRKLQTKKKGYIIKKIIYIINKRKIYGKGIKKKNRNKKHNDNPIIPFNILMHNIQIFHLLLSMNKTIKYPF